VVDGKRPFGDAVSPFPPLDASALAWASFYIDQSAAPIPVPYRTKKPTYKEWQNLRLTHASAADCFNGDPTNIGLLTGAASRGLTDGDLDCREAVILGDRFLPPTPLLFGRKSTGPSHRVWRVTPPSLSTTKFEDVEKGPDGERATLLEIRGDGGQTIFPPSVHPSGECVTFLCSAFAPAEVTADELLSRARLLAIACILARHWPDEGARHQGALGAAGLLLRADVPIEDVVLIVTSAAQTAGDREWRARRSDVLSTRDRIEGGGTVVGGPELAKVLRGNGADVVKRITTWLGVHRSGEPRWAPPADRPEIDTGNLGLVEMATAAWQAIHTANDPPRVFAYGTELAWLAQDPAGLPQVEVMHEDHVRHHLAEVATFTRWIAAPGRPPVQKPAFPPVALAKDLLAVPDVTLPRLTRIVRIPVFTADGRLLTEPGHDATSGIYFAPAPGLSMPTISEDPTAAEIGEAQRWITEELLGDFPWASDADRANVIALLLTLPLREQVTGDVPLFVLSKPTPRTGAGLLTKVVSLVSEGRLPAVATLSRDEEELRKRLTSFLLPSPSMLLLDNLHGRLDSAALAAILTCGGVWKDRLLGHTKEVHVPVRCAFVLTGNNVVMSTEMAGRSVLVRMDAKVEDPSSRTGFRHPNLAAWVLEHRGRLLWAVLTLGQAWIAAGRPLAEKVTFGGFEAWAATLDGVLDVAGVNGFLANRRSLFEQADEEGRHVRAFLFDWWTHYHDHPKLVRELLDLAKRHELPIDAKTERGVLVKFGRLVAQIEGRIYTLATDVTVAVRRVGADGETGSALWSLRRSPGSPGSPGSPSVNAYGRARRDSTGETDNGVPGDPGTDSEKPPTWVTDDQP
jgi:Bifunctional DNA primase/polymerase, N-terminal